MAIFGRLADDWDEQKAQSLVALVDAGEWSELVGELCQVLERRDAAVIARVLELVKEGRG